MFPYKIFFFYSWQNSDNEDVILQNDVDNTTDLICKRRESFNDNGINKALTIKIKKRVEIFRTHNAEKRV